MSNASSNDVTAKNGPAIPRVPWNPWLGVLYIVVLYFAAQLIGSIVLMAGVRLTGWPHARAEDWLNNSVTSQFLFILLVEAICIGGVYGFLRLYKVGWSAIGLRRPRGKDPLFGLVAWVVYFLIYLAAVAILSQLIPSLNVNQQQNIGFNNVYGAAEMIMTAISLVILPPLAEEIMVRGFLYGSLKRGMPVLAAAITTSLIFAAAHLPEGGASGPLYIAAIDTFILSLVLVYLREKTNSLWAGITLHALKNGVAFIMLFVLSTR